VNATAYDVNDSWIVTIGGTSAVVVTRRRKDDQGYELADDWRTISIVHIIEFSDLDNPGRTEAAGGRSSGMPGKAGSRADQKRLRVPWARSPAK
jgi:hypothetical protein